MASPASTYLRSSVFDAAMDIGLVDSDIAEWLQEDKALKAPSRNPSLASPPLNSSGPRDRDQWISSPESDFSHGTLPSESSRSSNASTALNYHSTPSRKPTLNYPPMPSPRNRAPYLTTSSPSPADVAPSSFLGPPLPAFPSSTSPTYSSSPTNYFEGVSPMESAPLSASTSTPSNSLSSFKFPRKFLKTRTDPERELGSSASEPAFLAAEPAKEKESKSFFGRLRSKSRTRPSSAKKASDEDVNADMGMASGRLVASGYSSRAGSAEGEEEKERDRLTSETERRGRDRKVPKMKASKEAMRSAAPTPTPSTAPPQLEPLSESSRQSTGLLGSFTAQFGEDHETAAAINKYLTVDPSTSFMMMSGGSTSSSSSSNSSTTVIPTQTPSPPRNLARQPSATRTTGTGPRQAGQSMLDRPKPPTRTSAFWANRERSVGAAARIATLQSNGSVSGRMGMRVSDRVAMLRAGSGTGAGSAGGAGGVGLGRKGSVGGAGGVRKSSVRRSVAGSRRGAGGVVRRSTLLRQSVVLAIEVEDEDRDEETGAQDAKGGTEVVEDADGWQDTIDEEPEVKKSARNSKDDEQKTVEVGEVEQEEPPVLLPVVAPLVIKNNRTPPRSPRAALPTSFDPRSLLPAPLPSPPANRISRKGSSPSRSPNRSRSRPPSPARPAPQAPVPFPTGASSKSGLTLSIPSARPSTGDTPRRRQATLPRSPLKPPTSPLPPTPGDLPATPSDSLPPPGTSSGPEKSDWFDDSPTAFQTQFSPPPTAVDQTPTPTPAPLTDPTPELSWSANKTPTTAAAEVKVVEPKAFVFPPVARRPSATKPVEPGPSIVVATPPHNTSSFEVAIKANEAVKVEPDPMRRPSVTASHVTEADSSKPSLTSRNSLKKSTSAPRMNAPQGMTTGKVSALSAAFSNNVNNNATDRSKPGMVRSATGPLGEGVGARIRKGSFATPGPSHTVKTELAPGMPEAARTRKASLVAPNPAPTSTAGMARGPGSDEGMTRRPSLARSGSGTGTTPSTSDTPPPEIGRTRKGSFVFPAPSSLAKKTRELQAPPSTWSGKLPVAPQSQAQTQPPVPGPAQRQRAVTMQGSTDTPSASTERARTTVDTQPVPRRPSLESTSKALTEVDTPRPSLQRGRESPFPEQPTIRLSRSLSTVGPQRSEKVDSVHGDARRVAAANSTSGGAAGRVSDELGVIAAGAVDITPKLTPRTAPMQINTRMGTMPSTASSRERRTSMTSAAPTPRERKSSYLQQPRGPSVRISRASTRGDNDDWGSSDEEDRFALDSIVNDYGEDYDDDAEDTHKPGTGLAILAALINAEEVNSPVTSPKTPPAKENERSPPPQTFPSSPSRRPSARPAAAPTSPTPITPVTPDRSIVLKRTTTTMRRKALGAGAGGSQWI